MKDDELLCVKCHKPVEVNREQYDIFEKMHWICFHFEYEHDGDPDKACNDPSCPWWQINTYKEALIKLGKDPKKIIETEINKQFPPLKK